MTLDSYSDDQNKIILWVTGCPWTFPPLHYKIGSCVVHWLWSEGEGYCYLWLESKRAAHMHFAGVPKYIQFAVYGSYSDLTSFFLIIPICALVFTILIFRFYERNHGRFVSSCLVEITINKFQFLYKKELKLLLLSLNFIFTINAKNKSCIGLFVKSVFGILLFV